MADHTDEVSALHNAREGIGELFSGERIAVGIVHDMVARLDPDLIGADRVVARGWRSALQVSGLQAHKNDAAFWHAMYGHYHDVCANTQSLAGDVPSFEVLFQADEHTSNWSPDDVATIMQFCREVPVQAPDEATESEPVGPQYDTESDVQPEVDPEDVDTEDVSAGDEQADNGVDDTADEPVEHFDSEQQDTEVSAQVDTKTQENTETQTAAQTEAETQTQAVPQTQTVEEDADSTERAEEQSEQPKRRRQRRKKPGKRKQKIAQSRKMREAPEREMSVKTAADGVIQPVDLDFRVAYAEHNAEIMPYVRSEVHADAAHIKGSISGIHLYLAHIAFDLLDEGLRARGVAHNLGLGSALSALLLAVLPISKTQYLKLSPMMEEAVDVMREKLSWSASEYLIDMGEGIDKAVGVLRDMFEMSSLMYQETRVNSYVSSLSLAERVGATNLPIGIQPEHIEVDNVAATEIARRIRAQIAEDAVYAEEREHRSANFFKNKDQ